MCVKKVDGGTKNSLGIFWVGGGSWDRNQGDGPEPNRTGWGSGGAIGEGGWGRAVGLGGRGDWLCCGRKDGYGFFVEHSGRVWGNRMGMG